MATMRTRRNAAGVAYGKRVFLLGEKEAEGTSIEP